MLVTLVAVHTCYDSGMITDDLSVTGCRYRGWIIVPIAKYEIIRERSVGHPSSANDGRLSAAPFIYHTPPGHPPSSYSHRIARLSHCSYIGRNCPLPLITSCLPPAKDYAAQVSNGALPPSPLGRCLADSNDSINRVCLAKRLSTCRANPFNFVPKFLESLDSFWISNAWMGNAWRKEDRGFFWGGGVDRGESPLVYLRVDVKSPLLRSDGLSKHS